MSTRPLGGCPLLERAACHEAKKAEVDEKPGKFAGFVKWPGGQKGDDLLNLTR